jgi:hypothetical protein
MVNDATDYVLIQDLFSRPNDPIRSYPHPLQVVKDLLTTFTQDKMRTSIPLFFPKEPAPAARSDGVAVPQTGHPIVRSDLNGSPRIALAVPPRFARRG